MQIDLSLNRVYWEYIQNNSYLRPKQSYICSAFMPSLGCKVTVPEYKRRGSSFKSDLNQLVSMFAKKYSGYKFVLALSGGIDSEVTAESFYTQGIPFRAISQRLFDGTNDFDIGYAAKYCKDREIDLEIVNLSMNKMIRKTIPEAVEHDLFLFWELFCLVDSIIFLILRNPMLLPEVDPILPKETIRRALPRACQIIGFLFLKFEF